MLCLTLQYVKTHT